MDGAGIRVERVGSQTELLSHGQPCTGMNGSGQVTMTTKIEAKRHGTSVCVFPIALARLGTRSLSTPWRNLSAQLHAAKLNST